MTVQDAGSRLRKGASALTAQLQKSQFFFAQLAQLQQHWNLKRSQPGGPGLFQIDVALPLGEHWQLHRKDEQSNTLVDVIQVTKLDSASARCAASVLSLGLQWACLMCNKRILQCNAIPCGILFAPISNVNCVGLAFPWCLSSPGCSEMAILRLI